MYVGGLSTELQEGDVLCVMSQWGEIDDINLPRDQKENKSQGKYGYVFHIFVRYFRHQISTVTDHILFIIF